MRKAVTLFFVAIIGLFTFVACNPDSSLNNELVNVTITSRDTRSLEASTDFDISSVTKWTYTAEKADNGLKTGETTEQVELVDGKTAQLSQGSWNFTLYGYNSENELICSGSVNNKTITTTNNSVVITVGPLQTEGGKGSIHILSDIALVDAKGNKYEEKEGSLTYVKNIYLYDSKGKELSLVHNDSTYDNIKSGFYCVKVEYVAKANDGTEYVAASGVKYFNVYDNLTTSISGTIEESTTSADISVNDGIVTVKKEVKLIASSLSSLNVLASPLETGNEDAMTSITIPANSVDADQDVDFSLVVYPAEVASSSDKFRAESGNSVVAGLDITLKNGENEITTFNNNSINVVTYIAKGLANVGVKYNGEGEQPTLVSYDDKTGRLEFTTTHLSEYYVVSSSVALDEDNNAYNNIDYPIMTSHCKSLTLLRDCKVNTNANPYRDLALNLNGFTVTVNSGKSFIVDTHIIDIVGPGTVIGDNPFIVYGDYYCEGKSILNISDDVKIISNFGIQILLSYGVEVNLQDVTIESKKDSSGQLGCGVYINGSLTQNDENAPKISIENSTITAEGAGIYAAGFGRWNIEKSDIKGTSSAIEIRAGELSIEGGIFESTSNEFVCEANGNGATTSGVAIAIAQHSTKLPVVVSISSNPSFKAIKDIALVNPQKNDNDSISKIILIDKDGSISSDSVYGSACKRTFENSSESRYYLCLEPAFCEDGFGAVVLLNDVISNDPLLIEKSLSLDLNGHSIENTEVIWGRDNSLLTVNNSKVVIYDSSTEKSGTIKALENDCYAINVEGGATLTIQSGNIIGNVSAVQVQKGELIITGGFFSEQQNNEEWTQKYLINCIDAAFKDGSAKVEISGGSFKSFNPSDSKAEPTNPTSFVIDGYKVTTEVVDNNTFYTVVPITSIEKLSVF